MTHSESAINDYIEYYGRVDISDMNEFFGVVSPNNSEPTDLHEMWRDVFYRRGVYKLRMRKNVEFKDIRNVSKLLGYLLESDPDILGNKDTNTRSKDHRFFKKAKCSRLRGEFLRLQRDSGLTSVELARKTIKVYKKA